LRYSGVKPFISDNRLEKLESIRELLQLRTNWILFVKQVAVSGAHRPELTWSPSESDKIFLENDNLKNAFNSFAEYMANIDDVTQVAGMRKFK
jgi:hypothetical protein